MTRQNQKQIMTKTKEQPLTIKQQNFVNAILSGVAKSGLEAAKIAGYNGSDNCLSCIARENYTKPHIKAYLNANKAQAAKKVNETVETIARVFQDLRQKAIEAGNLSEARQNNAELAKHLGFYELDNRQKQQIAVNNYTKEEILVIQQAANRLNLLRAGMAENQPEGPPEARQTTNATNPCQVSDLPEIINQEGNNEQ